MLKPIETIKMLPACLPSGWHDHHCPSCLCPAITIQLVPNKYSGNFADIYLLWKHVSLSPAHLPLIMMLKDMTRKIIWFQNCIFSSVCGRSFTTSNDLSLSGDSDWRSSPGQTCCWLRRFLCFQALPGKWASQHVQIIAQIHVNVLVGCLNASNDYHRMLVNIARIANDFLWDS